MFTFSTHRKKPEFLGPLRDVQNVCAVAKGGITSTCESQEAKIWFMFTFPYT